MTSTKPVWFIDVDGVINGQGSIKRPAVWEGIGDWNSTLVGLPGHPSGNAGPYRINYSTVLIDFLNEMNDKVDFVWLTSWLGWANETLAPALGIKDWRPEGFDLAGLEPIMEYNRSLFPRKARVFDKLMFSSVFSDDKAMFEGRPVIWTDDHLPGTVEDAQFNFTAPALFIVPKNPVGLTPDNLDEIRAFIESV